jgi:hypothetical protein
MLETGVKLEQDNIQIAYQEDKSQKLFLKLLFTASMLTGLCTGAFCAYIISRMIEPVRALNPHLGMSLMWSSGAFLGFGLVIGLVFAVFFSFFVHLKTNAPSVNDSPLER